MTDLILIYFVYCIAATALTVEDYDYPDLMDNWVGFVIYMVFLITIMVPLVYFPIRLYRLTPLVFFGFLKSLRSFFVNLYRLRPKFLYEPLRNNLESALRNK